MRDDLPALVRSIIEAIDDTPRLSALQQAAFAAAEARYHWADRGRGLREAVEQVAAARRRSAAERAGDAATQVAQVTQVMPVMPVQVSPSKPGNPSAQGTHG